MNVIKFFFRIVMLLTCLIGTFGIADEANAAASIKTKINSVMVYDGKAVYNICFYNIGDKPVTILGFYIDGTITAGDYEYTVEDGAEDLKFDLPIDAKGKEIEFVSEHPEFEGVTKEVGCKLRCRYNFQEKM